MNDLIALGRTLWNHAEPGFFETETHRILKERFTDLAFSVEEFEGIPGFVASADGRRDNKSIAMLADMDGLPTGPDGDFRHSCGHHLQMTALYGTARYLRNGAAGALSRIAFIATPAEEYLDFDRRETLRRESRIRRYSGKQELIERGVFEVLRFRFRGASGHAGAHPHLGKNAQNAASLFLQG